MRYLMISTAATFVLSTNGFAANENYPMTVNSSSSGESANAAPASGVVSRSGKSEMIINVHTSCYGTNLRNVSNPLAPNSIVNATFDLDIDGTAYPIAFEFPAEIVLAGGMSEASFNSMNASKYQGQVSSAAISGNTVVLKTPVPTNVSVSATGAMTFKKTSRIKVKMNNAKFVQTVRSCGGAAVYGSYGHSSYTPTYACGTFMGQNGALYASFSSPKVAADLSQVDIDVSFPGETNFCGSYWSPLMLFFDNKRPTFDNISSFPLSLMKKTYWPEQDSTGWFLALDRDHSGAIENKEELFGDNVSKEGASNNGFEVLKKLDSNHDNVIDEKDKQFKELLLWNDKNGDGISQVQELVKASQKITKISLKYKKDIIETMGRYAEARQKSTFWFNEGGKIKKGEVLDVWFLPAGANGK